jgi:hypothetical protein
MDADLEKRLSALESKLDSLYASLGKMRTYVLIVVWVTIGAIVLPLIGLMFAVPSFLSTYSSLDGLI